MRMLLTAIIRSNVRFLREPLFRLVLCHLDFSHASVPLKFHDLAVGSCLIQSYLFVYIVNLILLDTSSRQGLQFSASSVDLLLRCTDLHFNISIFSDFRSLKMLVLGFHDHRVPCVRSNTVDHSILSFTFFLLNR